MNIKSSTKFKIGIGVIVFIAVGTMSMFFYQYVKRFYVQETYQKTDLVLGHIDATIAYVQEELGPKMFHVLPKDDFVREAMSTSFVNKGVMSRFKKMFPGYTYRRVAIDPMNPKSKADKLEESFIHKFSTEGTGTHDWKGLISKGGQSYFIRVKGVVMRKECAACHGKPSNAPKSITKRYGTDHGFNWRVGDVVGLESLAIPMDDTFSRIQQVAFSIFCAGLTGMVLLSFALNYFYYVVTQRPLEKASAFFKSIVGGQRGLDVQFEAKGQDEISELAESFNHLIDHLRRSQQDFMSSELKYRRIFEGSKDAIIVADSEGTILDINSSGIDLLNIDDAGDVLGRLRIHDFFAGRESLDEFFDILEKAGFVKEYETVFKSGKGGEMNVLITATRRESENGGKSGYDCIVRNITQRKKMEQQLRQADKLASIGRLAAGVAHEINNPLSIVLGYAKLLKEEAAEAELREDLEAIHNNAAACKKIVEDLLNFSRQTKTHRVRADIRETVESVVSVVESRLIENRITLVRDYDSGAPRVAVDAGKIRQVWMNLIMNACQAISKNGIITISIRYEAADRGVFVGFADTGCGIPADIQDRIFDPFFTTKEPGRGTGLGLTVSYGIIAEHNGNIAWETGEGKGSIFTVWLPLGVDEDETIGAHC